MIRPGRIISWEVFGCVNGEAVYETERGEQRAWKAWARQMLDLISDGIEVDFHLHVRWHGTRGACVVDVDVDDLDSFLSAVECVR